MELPETIRWSDFAQREPELARFGKDRLKAGPAYLATIRRSGAPRVHPVTPIYSEANLFLFMEPTSPKARDLEQRGWYSIHSGVPDHAGTGGEFSATGVGYRNDDPQNWKKVKEASGYEPPERYIVFEFRVSEARCHGYGDVAMPTTRKWSLAGQ